MPQFEDFRGRKVNLPHPLERIISLNPSITETLFLLGMGDSVKGVSAFCRRPSEAEKVKKIGSYSTFNKKVVDEIKISGPLFFSISPSLFLSGTDMSVFKKRKKKPQEKNLKIRR